MEKSPKFQKAYKNIEFLTSHSARTIRLLSEYLEPVSRFNKYHIENTIVFFGSARSMNREKAEAKLAEVKKKLKAAGKADEQLENELISARGVVKMAPYYEASEELAFRLATWGKNQKYKSLKIYIASGGGDGMMRAANKGARKANAPSIGLNISLPMEQNPNPYISPELGFEFHYFFMRKFWFMYLAKSIVVFPGGFGTLDEFMEALTLIQTKKIEKKLVIVLFGKRYWNDILNFDKMVEWGVIAPEDLKLFFLTDSIDEAFSYITNSLTNNVANKSYYKQFVHEE